MNAKNSNSKELFFEFNANVNTKAPKNAWEKFYTYVWKKYSNNSGVMHADELTEALSNELAFYRAVLGDYNYESYFQVTFSDAKDYTWFVIHWS